MRSPAAVAHVAPRGTARTWNPRVLPVALAVALVACSSPAPASPTGAAPAAPVGGAAPAASAPAGQPVTMTTLTLSLPSTSAPTSALVIAEKEGFYARHGIELETTLHQGGPPALQAMMAGAAELTMQITGTTLNAIANGADIVIVAGQQGDPDYQLFARSEITSVPALDGRRLASADPGSELNTLLRKTLAHYGLAPDHYDIVPVGSTGARYGALTAGAVDGTLLSAPLTFDAETQGYRRLGTTTEAVPEYMFGTIAVRRDWARQNPELVVRFIRGYQDGLAWIYDPANRDKVIAHWVDISKSSPDAAAETYDQYVAGPLRGKVLPEQARISRTAMQAVIDLMTESNILQRPLTVDEVVAAIG